tara:strand:+ start:167 stop:943 length:777 start_codon:yes stop_codon:yes gene_type:complete
LQNTINYINNMYYIYHIPGKKIGVTRDLNKRVTTVQGYAQNEYEVLDASTDINYISDKELRLQKHFGYRVDRQSYKNLIKKMKINITEQTTTFPVPLDKLSENLFNNIGLKWETGFGDFEITASSLQWVLSNAKVSMYDKARCYIYNKAFYENVVNKEPAEVDFNAIREWANTRGIVEKGDMKTQLIKLYEETGELSEAILKNNKEDIIDAIGDSVIVLTNLAEMAGTNIEDCILSAYNEISTRTGRMINGTFVKDTI